MKIEKKYDKTSEQTPAEKPVAVKTPTPTYSDVMAGRCAAIPGLALSEAAEFSPAFLCCLSSCCPSPTPESPKITDWKQTT